MTSSTASLTVLQDLRRQALLCSSLTFALLFRRLDRHSDEKLDRALGSIRLITDMLIHLNHQIEELCETISSADYSTSPEEVGRDSLIEEAGSAGCCSTSSGVDGAAFCVDCNLEGWFD